jgi:hypothetical protein
VQSSRNALGLLVSLLRGRLALPLAGRACEARCPVAPCCCPGYSNLPPVPLPSTNCKCHRRRPQSVGRRPTRSPPPPSSPPPLSPPLPPPSRRCQCWRWLLRRAASLPRLVAAAAAVSREWAAAARHPRLWRHLFRRHFPPPHDDAEEQELEELEELLTVALAAVSNRAAAQRRRRARAAWDVAHRVQGHVHALLPVAMINRKGFCSNVSLYARPAGSTARALQHDASCWCCSTAPGRQEGVADVERVSPGPPPALQRLYTGGMAYNRVGNRLTALQWLRFCVHHWSFPALVTPHQPCSERKPCEGRALFRAPPRMSRRRPARWWSVEPSLACGESPRPSWLGCLARCPCALRWHNYPAE